MTLRACSGRRNTIVDHSPSAKTEDHIPEIIPYVSIPSGNPAAMAPRWEAEKEETSAAPMPTP